MQLHKTIYRLIVIPVKLDGLIDLDVLKQHLSNDVLLVSVMAVSNEVGTVQPYSEIGRLCREVGTVQPYSEIGRLCREVGAIFHMDAAQSAYEDIDIIESNIDMLSLSGGKLYGPTGVGVLIVDSMPDLKPVPLIHGGLQQVGVRSGTIPLYLCEAISFAIKKVQKQRAEERSYLESLRKLLLKKLDDMGIEYSVNGSMEHRHPGNLSLSFIGYQNDLLVQKLQPEVAVSTGAACNSRVIQQSYVLKALGLSREKIESTIRVGIGRFNTEQDILFFVKQLEKALESFKITGVTASSVFP
ncbi:cysteine desulfurase family protein [Oligella urethralis]|uniref:cysteine desulfurase family protein n=1 Tax=Oligella urethralis TaxID=90245 RepID=UPI002431086F|nr:aminotransferase class V-fold PLP-dependent enzyme [Oligella urethralis]